MRLRLRHERLTELVAASPLSQNHWALKIGLSRGHWSEILNGKHPYPSAKTRTLILEALGVELKELFVIETGMSEWADLDFRKAISDRFLIDTELGQGGMGAVYLARDVRHGRTVAVKVIALESISGIGVDQFRREISTVAKLHHPHTLPLYDSGEAAGQPFYVMPYVRGGSLRTRLAAETRLALPGAVRIVAGVAASLHSAHMDHVLHCDVKPENVLLFGDHPFVMDFGIARKLRSEVHDWSLRSELDLSAGTPAYVSPEQASGERNLDARSDVYSLGCMTFEMLTGRTPFEGANTQAVVSRRFIVPPPPLRDFAPEVPAAVQAVVERAMSLPREQRQRSAAEFASELQLAASGASRLFAGASLGAARAVSSVSRRLHLPRAHPRLGAIFDVPRDLVLAWRSLKRAPAFAAVVILTLGLALGANATMFGIVDRLWLRAPAHISNPDLVKRVRVARWIGGVLRRPSQSMTYPAFTDIRDHTTSFRNVAAVEHAQASLDVGASASALDAELVTGQYFSMLGVQPHVGRFFGEAEDQVPAGTPVAVLGYRTWVSTFGADPDIAGRKIRINGAQFEIIGVAPRDFTGVGLAGVDIWIPMSAGARDILGFDRAWSTDRSAYYLETFVRLKDDVSATAAEQDAVRAYQAAHAAIAGSPEGTAIASLGPLVAARDPGSRSSEPRVAVWLLGMAVVVLLIACANVANLVLARGVSRRGEIAIRRALGVTPSRLVRQLFTESVLLASLGALFGLALARWGGQIARDLLLPGVTWDASPLSSTVLMLTGAATIGAAIVAGIVPLLVGSRSDVNATLRGNARNVAGGHRRVLTALLLVQTTLATTLLVGAGLFVRSLHNVQSLDMGFVPQRLLYVTMNAPASAITLDEYRRLYRDAAERLRGDPGVRGAGVVIGAPFMANYGVSLRVPGRDSLPRMPGGGPYYFRVGAGVLEAMGTRLVRGRFFTDADDRAGASPTVVVTARTARELWPGENPLTKCLVVATNPCASVIGVIADIHRQSINEDAFLSAFIPFASSPDEEIPRALVVAVDGDARQAVERVRRELIALRPDLPYITIEPYHELIDPQARSWKLGATMFTIFGAVSLLMVAIGMYGVLAYLVSNRTRELGIRAALGAAPRKIMQSVLGGGLVTIAAGVTLGILLALGASSRIEPLLYSTSARDTGVYIAAIVVIVIVSIGAMIVPGLRAARIQPVTALRSE